jgi:hypothetical protein
MRNRQTRKIKVYSNLKERRFFLPSFVNLDRSQVEKKLWHFEDLSVRHNESRESDTTFRFG